MNKWQLTRYLIDAKKCIDSLMYINENMEQINNLDIKEIIENKLRLFYINLCIIMEHSNSFNIKELKKKDDIIRKIYYERDKNYAHKDTNYLKKNFLRLNEIINRLKLELEYCYKICKEDLPNNVSIDYVSYDKNLFRFVNQISPKFEKYLKQKLYKEDDVCYGKKFYVFNDTEDIKMVKNVEKYAVILENGLILKEGLQNRQDFCIKVNVLYNQEIWFKFNTKYDIELINNEKEFIRLLDNLKQDWNS